MDIIVKKRKRTVLTAKQHKILMKSFDYCAFPDAEQRLSLGKILGMSPRTVQIWFQNQRQKIKSQFSESRSSQNSEETGESVENPRIVTPIPSNKSLDILAHLACVEYDRKFGNRKKM